MIDKHLAKIEEAEDADKIITTISEKNAQTFFCVFDFRAEFIHVC